MGEIIGYQGAILGFGGRDDGGCGDRMDGWDGVEREQREEEDAEAEDEQENKCAPRERHTAWECLEHGTRGGRG